MRERKQNTDVSRVPVPEALPEKDQEKYNQDIKELLTTKAGSGEQIKVPGVGTVVAGRDGSPLGLFGLIPMPKYFDPEGVRITKEEFSRRMDGISVEDRKAAIERRKAADTGSASDVSPERRKAADTGSASDVSPMTDPSSYSEAMGSMLTPDQREGEVNHLEATPPPLTEPTAEELKPEKPTDTTPEFQQLMQNKPVAPETQKILEGLFPPQKVSSVSQYGDLQTAFGTGNYNTAGSSASQEDAPVFSPVDQNNINVAMVSGIYNSPVAV
jgi:hypothetical protein